MRKIVILLCFLFLPYLEASEPSFLNNKPLMTLIALDIIDLGQTSYIAGNLDRFEELNPIIGRKPSQAAVNFYFATLIATDIVMYELLPKKWAETYTYVRIGFQLACIGNNVYHGIKLTYRF